MGIEQFLGNLLGLGNQNINQSLTPGYNGQPNPMSQQGMQNSANLPTTTQTPMVSGQPAFLNSLAQLFLSLGKNGGARGQGFAQQSQQNYENQINSARLQEQQRQFNENKSLEDRRLKMEEGQNNLLKISNLAKISDLTGGTIEEAAQFAGMNLDQEQLERVRKIDERRSKKETESEVYVDPNPQSPTYKQILTEPDPTKPWLIKTDQKSAPNLLKVLAGSAAGYANSSGKVVTTAQLEAALKDTKLTPEQAGFFPLDHQGVLDILKSQNKPEQRGSVEQQQMDDWIAKQKAKGKNVGPSDYLVYAKNLSSTSSGGGTVEPSKAEVDPLSQSILAQTGLSLPAFLALTGQAGSLPRDRVTRQKAFNEAQDWAIKKGVDTSTLSSQFKTYNEVLSSNISRMNRTKIMENELEGTIQNLQGVVSEQDLKKLRFANVAKIWAGQEVNDSLAQQYAMHLYQLRNELAAYGAATQGRSGNEITLNDMREAELTIKNGISSGSLEGLEKAVKNSTDKMGTVMQKSVSTARKAVWDLFGVGQNYKDKTPTAKKQFSKSKWQIANPKGNINAAVTEATKQGYEVID